MSAGRTGGSATFTHRTNRLMSRLKQLTAALVLTTVLAAIIPASSATEPRSFIPVRVGRDAILDPDVRERALRELGEGSKPQHLVILIHGWDTPWHHSAEQYEEVASHIH